MTTIPYRPPERARSLFAAVLAGANLRQVDFTGANLARSVLALADLRGACLDGACLTSACLVGADFRGADLRGAILTGADVTGAKFGGALVDDLTRFPIGFDAAAAGCEYVDGLEMLGYGDD